MNLIALASLGAALMLVGCAANAETAALPADHPANPAAEVIYVPPLSVLVMDDSESNGRASRAPSGDHSQHVRPAPAAQSTTVTPQADDHGGHARKALEVSHTTQEQIDSILKAYLALTTMLAADKVEGAADQLASIRQAAKALLEAKEEAVWPLGERISKASPQKVEDIAAARTALKALSEPVIDLAQLAPPTKAVAPVIYQAYCPHIKASWLQPGEKIANPFFGSEMLGCGKVTQKIQPAKTHEH